MTDTAREALILADASVSRSRRDYIAELSAAVRAVLVTRGEGDFLGTYHVKADAVDELERVLAAGSRVP